MIIKKLSEEIPNKVRYLMPLKLNFATGKTLYRNCNESLLGSHFAKKFQLKKSQAKFETM